MELSQLIRDAQQILEAIPAPGAFIYNAVVTKLLKKSERKIAMDVIQKVKSGTLLDVGSGTGYLSLEIAKKNQNLQLYGIDLSKQMIKLARHHVKDVENIQFKLANAAALPFEDESIDFIISTGSMHHWKNPAKVFEECYRVLKTSTEAWIYDGCPEAIKQEAFEIKKEYGFFGYWLMIKIAELHGFSKNEYENKIKGILDQTSFKTNYKMNIKEHWMRIILNK